MDEFEEFEKIETIIENTCDLIEVNEVFDPLWEAREYTQIVFYEYRNKLNRESGEREWDYFIGDWRIFEVGTLRYSEDEDKWVVAFWDGTNNVIRLVSSSEYKHTQSNYDQEMDARKKLPQEERTSILSFSQ